MAKEEAKEKRNLLQVQGHTRIRKTEKQKEGEKKKSEFLVMSSVLPLFSVRLNKTKIHTNHANAVIKEQKYSGRRRNMWLVPCENEKVKDSGQQQEI